MSFLTPLSRQSVEQTMATEFAQALQTENPGAPIPNTGTGSTMGAAFRATSLQFVQNQNNLTAIASRDRLQTSTGPDVDSFIEPFGVTRNGASAASGSVTFSTNSPASQQLVVPLGTVVQTGTGVQFTVVADNSQPGYNATLGGYVIASGQSSVVATVECTAAGTVGNVLANQITTIFGGGGALPPVQNVTNTQGFTNGTDAELDAATSARFTLEVSGQHSGTDNAIAAAILKVQSGLTYTVGDRINALGQANTAPSTTTSGTFAIPAVGSSVVLTVANGDAIPFGSFVVAYDGAHAFYGQVTDSTSTTLTVLNVATLVAGTLANASTVLFAGPTALFTIVVNVLGQASGPSQVLLDAVAAAVESVRPGGSVFGVIAPTLVAVNGVLTAHVASNADQNAISAALSAAYDGFVNNIGLDPAGNSTICPYFDVAMTLREVSGVTRIDGLTLNGGTSDITATFGQQLVAGTLTVTFVSP